MTPEQFKQAIRALNQAGESGWDYRASPKRQSYTIYAFGGVYRSYPLLLRVIESRSQGRRPRAHDVLLARVAGRAGGPTDPSIEDW